MKTSTLERNGVSAEMVDLIGRLIDLIAWPARRSAMSDVTMALLDGKQRVAYHSKYNAIERYWAGLEKS